MTNHHSPGHRESHHDHEPELAEMLDVDAVLLREHLQEIFEWVATRMQTPGTIVDLGAGTGTGTLGLASTFPKASVVAVDQSEFMLNHLASAVEQHWFSERVSTLQIDLDTAWPTLSDIDLAWAASSLHHMTDPDRVLNQIGAMLAPEGLLAGVSRLLVVILP